MIEEHAERVEMDLIRCSSIKLAVDKLYESAEGQHFIEFLETMCGQFGPTYNETEVSIMLSAGRSEVMASIRNLHRLSAPQILQMVKGK